MSTLTRTRSPRRRPLHAELLTYDDFLALDLDYKADLINGRIVTDMPTYEHEDLFAYLLILMRVYAEQRQLGIVLGSRTPVVVDGRSGFEPDILFVSEERRGIVRRLDLSHGPDVAVEIVSAVVQAPRLRRQAGGVRASRHARVLDRRSAARGISVLPSGRRWTLR